MTQLCAPVKQLLSSDKVELVETPDKIIYQQGRARYVDVDWKTAVLPEGDVIVSYHNFEETPNLEAILKILQMKHPKPKFYKIATMARSIVDSLRMLEFLQRHPGIIGLCMGDLGAVTRICAPIFQVPMMYAPLVEEDKNAPGQLLVDQLCEIYQFRALNTETKIYGLIGDPVFRSIGHLFHNDAFRKAEKNAVYLKMVVKSDELDEFFRLAKKLPFAGLSVTAPLKEAVLEYVDVLHPEAKAIGAVNTLTFKDGKVYGTNTDGDAAVDVLGNVKNKTVVVLGAGGSARAIGFVAKKRGAKVVIVNRTSSKAEVLARDLGCQWSSKIPSYDILVNATTSPMPVLAEDIQEGKQVMDIALYETEFLKAARKKNCSCLDGFPMYFQQAFAQQAMWGLEESHKWLFQTFLEQ
jgi:3-dehydroquinate dehydratase/shikimate dehydrogenase